MQTCLFTNWTDETFTGVWDKQSYEIKSGASIYLEDWKAEHFAKHLIDRELNKIGKSTADPIRDALKAKCFGSVEAVKTDILNKVEAPKAEGKEIKEEKKIDKRTKEYKENKEKFEGLKTNE